MEKQIGQIKFTETDSGYRIDVEGKDLKDLFSGCCAAFCCSDKGKDEDCCGSDSEKK